MTHAADGKIYGGYSQHGEHILIDQAFGKRKRRGYAVDVGACDGVSLSNTKHLEDRGWDVLCIEANPAYAKALKKNRKRSMVVACGKKNLKSARFGIFEGLPGNFEAVSALKPDKAMLKHMLEIPEVKPTAKPLRYIKVPVRTLDWCLEKAKFPRLDLVSIDVEGGEGEVLEGFDIDRWQPTMVVLEDWYGGRYRQWMCRKGYWVVRRLGPNEVFLRV